MYSEAFSLLELIFAILIVSIISSIAVSKFGSFIQESKLSLIKSDIALIQSSIISKANILSMQGLDMIDSLETGNTQNQSMLFNAILKTPFDSNSNHAKWSKIDDQTYEVTYKNKQATFLYDKDNVSFLCKSPEEFCKKIK